MPFARTRTMLTIDGSLEAIDSQALKTALEQTRAQQRPFKCYSGAVPVARSQPEQSQAEKPRRNNIVEHT